MLGGGSQPVFWLMKNREKLYKQCKEEATLKGRVPIGQIRFFNGLESREKIKIKTCNSSQLEPSRVAKRYPTPSKLKSLLELA